MYVDKQIDDPVRAYVHTRDDLHMLEVLLSLVHDIAHNESWQQGEADRDHEKERDDTRLPLLILVLLEDGIGVRHQLELEVLPARRRPQDRLIHVLRVSNGHILTRSVNIVDHLPVLGYIVRLIDQIGAESVRHIAPLAVMILIELVKQIKVGVVKAIDQILPIVLQVSRVVAIGDLEVKVGEQGVTHG